MKGVSELIADQGGSAGKLIKRECGTGMFSKPVAAEVLAKTGIKPWVYIGTYQHSFTAIK